MRSGLPQEQLNNLAHRRYVTWASGDGATTQFALPKNVARLDDLLVFVAGLLKRPSAQGTSHDYDVRGVTAGYSGDPNRVRFAVAPANGAAIAFIQNAE